MDVVSFLTLTLFSLLLRRQTPQPQPNVGQDSSPSSVQISNHSKVNQVSLLRKATSTVLDSGGLTSIGVQVCMFCQCCALSIRVFMVLNTNFPQLL